MKTIVLDGIEYVLTPKEQVLPTPPLIESIEPSRMAILDFQANLQPVIPTVPVVSEYKEYVEPGENIEIVDARFNSSDIPEAKPGEYEYRKRFKSKKLLPQDVIGFAGTNRHLIDDFEDLPEFAADERKPKEKRLYYGPGIEIDSPSVV